MHAAGIVHRDVKPSNVLLARGRSGRPLAAKLADFGIACSIENTRLTTPGIVLGTLTYMAPEQLRDADPSTPVDIFALGLVVLEALSGETGYAALGSGRAAAIARLAQPPMISQTVPEEWRDLLTRMTRLEPEERPNAAEVARAARGLLRGYAADAGGSAVAAAAAAIVASAGADPTAGATAVLPAADVTGVTAVADVTPVADAAASRNRRRNRVLAGAAGVVATGAIVVGIAAFTAPASAELSRTASAPVVRVPTETVPADVPAAPVEVVTESEESTNNGNNGNSGESGNSGNSGKGDKGDKGDKGKGKGSGG